MTARFNVRQAAVFAGLVFAWLGLSSCVQAPAVPIAVAIFAINDFHGNLMPPQGGFPDPATGTSIPAGGAEYLATLIHQLRARQPNSIFVAAGDLIGASPALSSRYQDEPAIEALSLMGLEASSVGNHEFDKGSAELLRLQNGGCNASAGCKGPRPFTGAGFRYLSANVVVSATGKTLFAPYYIKSFGGVRIAFIGLTLKGTPGIVAPAGTAGLEFRDEVETVNALVPQLHAQGVRAIVVLVHQGGVAGGGYNDCNNFSGALGAIVPRLDKSVSVVISGHTHRAYNCVIDGRTVTSAYQYGMMVTKIDLELDPATQQVISQKAENLLVEDRFYARDPGQTRLLSDYEAQMAQFENRVLGNITASLTRARSAGGESALGDVIADAQLAALAPTDQGGAQIAFMNNGGIRSDLVRQGDGGAVTFGNLFAVQPFANRLLTLTLTGAQIKTLLEQQWTNPAAGPTLQVSRGFSYGWQAGAPIGDRVRNMTLNGIAVNPERSYRVGLSDFLAGGGDGLTVLRQGTNPQAAMTDIEAAEAYIRANSPITPGPLDRIRRLD